MKNKTPRKWGQESFSPVSNYSTVTDLMLPTPNEKYIPFLSFVCVIIYSKGSIVSYEYKNFDIIFIPKC